MKILPFYSQYIFSVLIYIINNRHLFITNQEVHNINTRSNLKFHVPNSDLTKFQKGVYYTEIKLFNDSPSSIRSLSNDTNLFKTTLKNFFYNNSFYSIEEYHNFQADSFQVNELRLHLSYRDYRILLSYERTGIYCAFASCVLYERGER
jgi:hypothetical protein